MPTLLFCKSKGSLGHILDEQRKTGCEGLPPATYRNPSTIEVDDDDLRRDDGIGVCRDCYLKWFERQSGA